MKKVLCMILVCVTIGQPMFASTVNANEIDTVQINVASENNQRKDVIEYKIRTYNGVQQYRRWNVTQNRWVDADWINLI